jgi:uncharacterized membrane protein
MAEQPPVQSTPQNPPPPASGSGLSRPAAGLVAYLLGWIGGLIVILVEKENREVKFYGWQAIALDVTSAVVFIVLFFLGLILGIAVPPLGFLLLVVAYLAILGDLVLHVVLAIQAYQGQATRLPLIGGWAANQAGI